MANIVVDKNELNSIRDHIDYLLQKGKQSFAIDIQQRIYDSDDLNEKEQLIIKHLNKNPGINKEEIVNLVKDNYSRVTVLHTISGLIEKGLIIAGQDKMKKRTYHLYVNYQNIISALKEDLGVFKYYYCELLDNAIPIVNSMLFKEKKGTKRFLKFYDLITALIGPYKYLCIMFITSDIFLWSKRPLDDDTLHRKYAIFFKTAKEIHAKLVKIWPASDSEFDSPVNYILNSISFGFNESYILRMLKIFEQHRLSEWAEAVIDVLWKMSYPLLPLIDSSYDEYLKKGILEDWRQVLENNPESNYKPKTEQLPFDH
jgi:hypothetical protein